ncbi:hypothetical protein MKX01_029131 [Papaver californicum]|nr:hypothetical protein MKX01_029131 [Papaver californicum]
MSLGDKIFYNNHKVLIVAVALVLFCGLGLSCESNGMAMVSDVRDSSEGSQNNLEIEDLAKYVVVAVAIHHLTLEVIEAGKKKFYEAKIWVKPWMNFKELQEFKRSDHEASASTCTPSDFGVKRDSN